MSALRDTKASSAADPDHDTPYQRSANQDRQISRTTSVPVDMGGLVETLTSPPLATAGALTALVLVLYMWHINRLLSSTPEDIRQLATKPWTQPLLKSTYELLEKRPIELSSYRHKLPPKLERRYVVTGGSGLVGGHIVLQLLARGQPAEAIRIVDLQEPHRRDMQTGSAAEVDFIRTDISSAASTEAAFSKPWHPAVASLPLTVFHTAAVIVPSERSKLVYGFVESINVRGTQNVLSSARRAGADIFVFTSSASISIRPVDFWVPPWDWKSWPKNYAQLLDEADFFRPLRDHEDFFANYPASKATAERIVCGANEASFRTGAIRPANGVYGHPTDNTVGGPLHIQIYPAWSGHIVQSFVHGVNCAIAHLQFEAVLARPGSELLPQAGRPFTVTDPNPPITYADLWMLIATLSVTPFRTIKVQPVPMLVLAYAIEAYCLLLVRYPVLRKILPTISGDVKHLKPPLFSIVTHLYATNEAAGRSVENGGLGYKGVLTTLEGMCQEVLDWNREHSASDGALRTRYKSSVSLAEEIERRGAAASTVNA